MPRRLGEHPLSRIPLGTPGLEPALLCYFPQDRYSAGETAIHNFRFAAESWPKKHHVRGYESI